jgi:hypothetical protein
VLRSGVRERDGVHNCKTFLKQDQGTSDIRGVSPEEESRFDNCSYKKLGFNCY